MILNKYLGRTGLLTAFGASAAILLSGCGGTTTSPTQTPATQADPTIFGSNFATGLTGSNFVFSNGTDTVGAIIAAISSTASGFALEGGPAAGFVPGGQNPVGVPAATAKGQTGTPPFLSFGFALAPSQPNVVFRALIANGNNGETVDPINVSSVFLTSSEAPSLKEQLTFDKAGIANGPAGDGQYATPPFTLPFTTTGLHTFSVSIASQSGKSSSTTFQTLVLAPTDSAVVVQVLTLRKPGVAQSNTNPVDPVGGALVTVTNALSGVTAYGSTTAEPQTSVTDANGVAIVFCAPGSQTITATADPASATDLATGAPVKAMLTASDTETLIAGQALTALPNTSAKSGDALASAYAIEVAPPAAAAARRGHARVQGQLVKRPLKH